MADFSTYKDAGVDIDKADAFINGIRTMVKSTYRTGVLGEIGSFGGMFHLGADRYHDPVLVSSTDGVGTKIKIAIMMNRHDTIGIDLVAMCVNDIIVHGATPLFFLDYLAVGQLSPEIATLIVEGITHGCRQARCSLIGGETAEMPGIYQIGDYDLAGFVVGVVERDQIIDGSSIAVGHRLIGLASSGLHANGFSLVRQVLLERHHYLVDDVVPELGGPLGEELLKPTRIYVDTVLNLLRDFPAERHLPYYRRRLNRQCAPRPAQNLPGGHTEGFLAGAPHLRLPPGQGQDPGSRNAPHLQQRHRPGSGGGRGIRV